MTPESRDKRVEWKPEGSEEGAGGSADAAEEGGGPTRPQAMPGVLKKSQDDLRIMKSNKRRIEDEMADQPAKKVKKDALSNGTLITNGVKTNGVSPGLLETHDIPVADLENLSSSQLPPEFLPAPVTYVSISTLITRLAQDTFNQLVDTINDLSEAEVTSTNTPLSHDHGNAQTNGITGTISGTASNQANIRKRQQMLNFAQDRRTQFIKVLVLSQWCQRAEEMERVIDVGYWMKNNGKVHIEACAGWMRQMTRNLNTTKVPNPDFKTSLEALSLGKASWLTDRIPPQFREFKIASARATFTVKNEFQVDLAIADEDPKSQFYFLDFRFLFSPVNPVIPLGRLRDELESKLNEILRVEGLGGCYNFLHNLVLTHKLSVLRNQAFEMVRGSWSDQVKVEAIHRSLVVQYWLQRPGSKNWIEIGIKRGRNRSSKESEFGQDNLEIGLRWFRAGKEMKDTKVDLGLDNLSLTGILKRIIGMHTTYILTETAAKLREESLYRERLLKLKQSYSTTEPNNISLLVQLTRSKAIKITQEPITGRFAILPPGPRNSASERELNSLASPATEAPARLATLRCITAREEFESCARKTSWEVVRSLNVDRESLHRFFPRTTLRIAFFRKLSWESNWVLALTTSLKGDAVWIAETSGQDASAETTNKSIRPGSTIRVAFEIPNPEPRALLIEPSYANIKKIERTAVGMIAQHLDTHYLLQKRIPYVLRSDASASGADLKSLYIKYSTQKIAETLRSSAPVAPNWRNDTILLRFGGIDNTTSFGNHTVRARMKIIIPNLKALTSTLSSSVSFHPSSGEFAFRLSTPVGESTIPNLTSRLESIEHFLGLLKIIKRRKLPCVVHSLARLSFEYAAGSNMKATIDFGPDERMRITFDPLSPHFRVQDDFTEMLRSPAGGLDEVLAHIDATLPLLRGISDIASSWADSSDSVDILSRSTESFTLRYHNPNRKIDVSIRDRRGEIMWLVKDRGAPKEETRDEDLEKSLKQVANGSGQLWRVMNEGVVTTTKGAENLISKMDGIFRAVRKAVPDTTQNAKEPTQGMADSTNSTTEENKAATANPLKRKAGSTEEDAVELD
ncbi:MAG: hypothetical protein Q9195_000167 [Heterodermia aff. obscurata]